MPRSSKGFTLLEILVAVSIVSVVALLGIPNLKRFNEAQEFQANVSELTRVIKKAQSNSQSSIVCADSKRSSQWVVILVNPSQYTLSPLCPDSGSNQPIETKNLPTGTSFSVKSGISSCTFPVSISYANKDRSLSFSAGGCSSPTRLDIDFQGPKNESARVYVDLGGAIGQCGLDSMGVCK